MFQAESKYAVNDGHRFTITGRYAFYPEGFMESLICAPALLLPTGIALFFLGLAGFQHLRRRNKLCLTMIFVTSILFALCGAPSAWIIFAWWVSGGFGNIFWWQSTVHRINTDFLPPRTQRFKILINRGFSQIFSYREGFKQIQVFCFRFGNCNNTTLVYAYILIYYRLAVVSGWAPQFDNCNNTILVYAYILM